MSAIYKHKILVSTIIALCLLLIGAAANYSASAYSGQTGEISAICVDEDSNYEVITIGTNAKTTALDVKQKIAQYLNDGVSPENIVLMYNSWSDVKENLPDAAVIANYQIDTVYFAISPLAMGTVFKSGDAIDFGEGSSVHAKYCEGDIGYFYGENAISCRGFETVCGERYIKFIIGNIAIYFTPESENIAPIGLKVAHISYDPYNGTFIYGFDVAN